ncbi:hypothetical protein G4228_019919 [Cervus hanglu yarkandensis]|uniref:Ig-like domain-containing protein n=1 Tax=Cervus hanglu yarkandensis TaxID=84702 RepID=A0A833VSQ3_9CERV|nr:hypothetical protein G4228_019919 [Cervus hanglu yarkandensis]
MGYLDGQTFLHFDDTKWRAEPQGQWAERLGAETWETESKDLNEAWKELRKLLAEILSLQEEKRVPPAVNVTRSQDSEGMVHLTCRAFGFFPRNISVAWFQDEEPMNRDALESGGVLPDGNGTYYTWETIIIPQGEEQRVKCLVEHSGNHSTHLAPLGETGTLVHQRSWWIVSVPVAVVFIIGFCVSCYIKKRKTVSATGRPEPISLQDRDQFQMEPTDHNSLNTPRISVLVSDSAPQFNRGSLESAARRPEFSS